MIVLTILAMSAIVFLSRYVFLEPNLPIKLNSTAKRFLGYSAPAVLAAIIGPILFLPEGELLVSVVNPYLLGGIIAVLVTWRFKNVLLAVAVSTAVFMVLRSMI
ncbi:AzlD domain-containing protein [Reinekea marinisedimentorum]|uniref:Branched-subunit amino acid transport protein n=1 Tax=Reinekea marinisedimentorum TaxID=230495 RepID=A0A4R3I360_9GAMM|nr:AzlD domain-containing protein [Reinekea marinisedimentorum]TCS40229.1 branched-subunit amino acid transport protein [Reinekea marinisedimentorum]